MLFRAEKARSYLAYRTRLTHGVVEIWVKASGQLRYHRLREKTLQSPADNWMRTVGKSPQEDFFFKKKKALWIFALFFFSVLLVYCLYFGIVF